MSPGAAWRDLIQVHPACGAIPDMDADQFDELAASVRQTGDIIQPIVKWRGSDGAPWQLLDGRHRLDALSLLPDAAQKIGKALQRCVYKGPETDPWQYSLSVNLTRRHLDASQRAMIGARIANLRRGDNQHPSIDGTSSRISQADAAKMLSVSPKSVERAAAVQREGSAELVKQVERGEVSVSAAAKSIRPPPAAVVNNTVPRYVAPESVVGQFRVAPSAVPRPAPSVVGDFKAGGSLPAAAPPMAAGPQPSPSLKRDRAIGEVCDWLRADLRRGLDDLLLIVRDEQHRIADLPLDKRVILARGYLQALGVTADDLKKTVL